MKRVGEFSTRTRALAAISTGLLAVSAFGIWSADKSRSSQDVIPSCDKLTVLALGGRTVSAVAEISDPSSTVGSITYFYANGVGKSVTEAPGMPGDLTYPGTQRAEVGVEAVLNADVNGVPAPVLDTQHCAVSTYVPGS